MQKGMNRKGQEGVTIGTLLLIVLGIVVVVVLIIGATNGFDFIFGKIDTLPGQDLQAVAQGCIIAAQNSLTLDYCEEFKEIELDGEKRLVNCEYSKISDSVKATQGITNVPDCSDNLVQEKCVFYLTKEVVSSSGEYDGVKCSNSDLVVNDVECKTFCDNVQQNVTLVRVNN